MEIAVYTAIIGAASGLVGATIPQLANWLITFQNYKRELRKEYHLNKVNTYGEFFAVISDLTYDIRTTKERNLDISSLLKDHISNLDQLLLKKGIWLDDEEIDITKNIIRALGAIIIDEIERKSKLPLSNYNINLISNIEDLRTICRTKARKAYLEK